jgi:hypothetical protein
LLRDRKDGVMCKVGIDYSVGGAFGGGQGNGREGGRGDEDDQGERKREKIERDEKEKVGVKKGKWSIEG